MQGIRFLCYKKDNDFFRKKEKRMSRRYFSILIAANPKFLDFHRFVPTVDKLKYCIAIVLVALFFLAPAAQAQINQSSKVLMLHSYHKGLIWTDSLTNGVESVLQAQERDIQLTVEYMDTKRISDPQHFANLLATYKYKFKNVHFDVIITADDDAFYFALQHRIQLFGDVTMVFCGLSHYSDELRKACPELTGVIEKQDILKTMNLALRLHKKAQKLFIINDLTTTGRKRHKQYVEASKKLYRKVEVEFLEDLSKDELINRLENLPTESVVILHNFNRDNRGQLFSHRQAGKMVRSACKQPVYSSQGHNLGLGIVGGYLTSGEIHGKAAAKMVLDILGGKKASQIPIVLQSPNPPMFDYAQMKKHNLSQDLLPLESVLINEPAEVKERKRFAIIFLFAFLETVIILWLLLSLFGLHLRLRILKDIEYRVIAAALVFGLVVWVFDAIVDAWIFYEGTFWSQLILDVPKHEIYMRLLIITSFTIFGIIIAISMAKRRQAEQSLRLQNTAIYNSTNGVIIADHIGADDNPVIYVNPTFERITGYSLDEVKGRDCRFLQGVDSDQPGLVEIRRALREERSCHVILRNYRKDGKMFWNELNIVPVRDKKNKLTHYIGILTNITKRREAEQALEKSEERLSLALDAANDGLWDWNIKTGDIYFSPRYYTMLGYEPNEFGASYQAWAGLLHPDEREATEKRIREHIERRKESFAEQFRLRTKTGDWRWVLSRAKVVERDAAGESVRMVGTHVDITERKQAEKNLRIQRYYLEKAQEIGSIGTWELDIKKNKLVWTDQNYRIFSVPIGTELTYEIFFNCIHPDDRQYVDKQWAASLKGKPYNIEHRIIVEGKVKWVREKAELQFDEKGQCIRGIGFTQDITERKEAQNQIAESEERFRTLVANLPGVVYRCQMDEYWTMHYMSEMMEKVSGYPACDFLENRVRSFASIIYPEDREMVKTITFEKVNKGRSFMLEYRIITSDGNIKWVFERGRGIRDEEGNVLFLDGVLFDVTDRKLTEEKLKDSEKRIRVWLEYSPVCTKIVDLDFNLQYMSRSGIEDLKIDDITQFYGKPFPFDLYPESFRNSMTKNLERVKETGEVITQEVSMLDTEGNELWYHSTLVPVNDDEGRIDYIMIVSIDTTDRRQAEKKMQDLAKFPSENPNPVLRITKDGLLLHSNPASESFLKEGGYQVGRPVSDQWRQMVSEVFASGCEKSFEIPHSGRIFSFVFTPVTEAGYVNLYGRDITERKQARQALYASEEKFRLLFETSPLGIALCEMDGTFIQANQAYLDIIGYSHKEMVKLRYWDVTPRDYYVDEAEQLRAIETTGRYGPYEKEYIRKTGERIPVLLNGMVVKGADEVERIWSIVEDITDRKHAEEERERLVKNLAAKTEDLENIVYVSSHDLRSPLLNIQGYSGELGFSCDKITEIIENSHTPQEIRDNLSKVLHEDIPLSLNYITASADKMNMLLVGLLKLSRLGTAALEIETLDMNLVIAQVLNATQYQIKECRAEVIVDELPACLGDHGQITQVFTNLLDNALKYLDPNRKAKIHISGHTDGPRSVYCTEDNGIGIDKNHFDNIFEIFHQLNPTEPPTGQGMGLTIVRRILDRHNGKVWVESEPGKGSRFYVALPNP